MAVSMSLISIGSHSPRASWPGVSWLKSLDWRPFQRVTVTRNVPWLTDGAIDFLDGLIARQPELSVLEFGSGASTVYLAQRVGRLVSYEHNYKWHRAVSRRVLELGAKGATLNFHRLPYFQEIDKIADRSLDLVLIDGRDRIECVRRSMAKVKPGGVIMIDNMERDKYHAAYALMAPWSVTDFEQIGPDRTGWRHNGKPKHKDRRWITTVWIKPATEH
jgi:predicted O-methyltransferase YrrM